MKVSISDQGDRSVGINPVVIDIEINLVLPLPGKEREDFREDFYQAAQILGCEQSWGRKESISVIFEDECVECRSILKDNKCINRNCIMTYWREDSNDKTD